MIKTVDKATAILKAEYPPHACSVNRGYPVDIKNLLQDLMRECAQYPLPLEDDPTVTSYWYKYVKPLLARLGIIKEESTGKEILFWRSYHNKRCAELVRAGGITYRQLNIIDRSRQSISAESVANNPNIICLVEKDAAYSVMKKLNAVYGVNVLEGHGMPSLAKVENMLDELRGICPGETIVLITFTDYNPAGWRIATSFTAQVRDLWAGPVEHYHAGLYLEQFNGRDISGLVEPVKATDEKKADWVKWLEENDRAVYLVDGIPKGVELDALGSQEIYKCINDYILDNYDLLKLLNTLSIDYQGEVVEKAVDIIAADKAAEVEAEIRKLEQRREGIYSDAWDAVYGYLEQYDFAFSFNLSEKELRQHYQNRQFAYNVKGFHGEEIYHDANELAGLI